MPLSHFSATVRLLYDLAGQDLPYTEPRLSKEGIKKKQPSCGRFFPALDVQNIDFNNTTG